MILIPVLALYLLPFIIAVFRHKKDKIALLIVNLFFGWTVLGWVVCLSWAFLSDN